MRRRTTRKQMIADINVVPYIDVMLVLLIIFMITTPLLTQGVTIELPQASAKLLDDTKNQPIIITVDAKGKYYLNVSQKPETPLTARALVSLVSAQVAFGREIDVDRAVLIRGDKAANYGDVVRAMTLLQTAGVDHVGLMTQPGEVDT
jgi:biopolymer transport protein TolR